MNWKTIALMGAIPEETREIAGALCGSEAETYGGVDYYMGQRGQYKLIVCYGGVGKANAAATTQALISHFGVEALIFTGLAGNMTSEIGMGDAVIGQELCYHDTDPESKSLNHLYTADPLLVRIMEEACRRTNTRFAVGRIATGDTFVGSAAHKRQIQEKWNPLCVEMEGAGMAQIATRNNVPFAVLRVMSDNSDATVEELGGDDFDLLPFVARISAVTLAAVDVLASEDGIL